MKRLNFEAPVMELINIGAEDIICASVVPPESIPHFIKGNDALTTGEKDFSVFNFTE